MAELATLTEEDCWEKISVRGVERLGFDMGRGPRIHPVNYTVDRGTVVLRTAEDTELARFIELLRPAQGWPSRWTRSTSVGKRGGAY